MVEAFVEGAYFSLSGVSANSRRRTHVVVKEGCWLSPRQATCRLWSRRLENRSRVRLRAVEDSDVSVQTTKTSSADVEQTVQESTEEEEEKEEEDRTEGDVERSTDSTGDEDVQSSTTAEEGDKDFEIPPEDVSSIRLIFGSETFFATEILKPPGGLVFRGNLRGEPDVTLKKLEARLSRRLGEKYTLCLAEGEDDRKPMVVVVPSMRDKQPSTTRQRLGPVLMLVGTIITCVSRASSMFGLSLLTPDTLWTAGFRQQVLPLGLAIACVILLGAVVQRLVAAKRQTQLAPPILLPSYALGSYGPMTNVTTPPASREALFDIALAGAGTLLVVSLIMFVAGVLISTSAGNVWTVPSSLVSDSLLLTMFTKRLLGPSLLRSDTTDFIGLHWLAVLGANCAMIAAFNLLPIRQLDGGRLVSAVFGRKTATLASRVTIFLVLMSTPNSSHLLFFLAFVLFGPWTGDRPARNELSEPDDIRAAVGLASLFLMMLLLLPRPNSMLLF